MVRQQKNEELMAAGVTLDRSRDDLRRRRRRGRRRHGDPPGRLLEGATTIGAACEIHAGSRIVNSTIGDRVIDPQLLA